MDAGHVDTDVAVIGGGPAGSAAAITCAARGLRVRLFERALAQDRPGETLHPGVEPLLAQLGVAERLPAVVGARHEGIWVDWGATRRFEQFGGDAGGPWRGLQVRRAGFDALLRERARALGVAVCQPCAVAAVLAEDGLAARLQTAAGPVTARMLVDASGAAQWLGRRLGIARQFRSPRLIARYGYREGSCPARDAAPALCGDAAGWVWTARVRPGLYQWIRVALDGQGVDPGWSPEEFRGLRPSGRARGADVTWRIAGTAARPGWFMVGDAAASLDPAASHGVLKALMSGIAAGHLIAAVLAGKAPAAGAAIAYHDWLAAWFARDAARLAEFYRRLGATGIG